MRTRLIKTHKRLRLGKRGVFEDVACGLMARSFKLDNLSIYWDKVTCQSCQQKRVSQEKPGIAFCNTISSGSRCICKPVEHNAHNKNR